MSDMKCPICQQELKPQTMDGGWLECWNCSYREPNSKHLPQPILCGSRELWQELDRWKQSAEDHQNWLRLAEKKLERTRKALEIAVDAIKSATEYLGNQEPLVDVMAMNLHTDLSKALEQITAEQKD